MYFLLTLIVIFILFHTFAPQFGQKPFGDHLQKIKKSPQYRKNKFENTHLVKLSSSFWHFTSILWELLQPGKQRRPRKKLPSQQPTFNINTGAYLTWFGHSTFLYEIDGKKILFDPMLGKHASPVPGFVRRYPYILPSSAQALPYLDAVIISHDHFDHLDYGTIKIIKEKVGRFIMPLGVGAHLVRWGVPPEKITELDWWDETKIDGIMINATPSQHFSGRSIGSIQKTLWASWVIQSPTAKVFFSGDTGYFNGFKTIGEKFGPFDLTLLDSGQYNKNWEIVHMFPEQSVVAHSELRGKVFMPIHWSAFTLALHGWSEPAERAVTAAQKNNIEMVTPMIGERFNILTERPKKLWWREVTL